MEYTRLLNLKSLLEKKSFFLLGPRATGKTSLIMAQLKDQALIINLLKTDLFFRLNAKPARLREMIKASKHRLIVIDEIQKIPDLLNEVHFLIEEEKLTFLLTGSSARKLKGKNVNLLAGRAWETNLFPLTYAEIKNFNLEKYLQYGGLPAIYTSTYPEEELNAYAHTYLKEEIMAEAVVRQIPAFAKFLELSALTSGQILNFSNIANDTGVSAVTIREYYQILEDTLLGFMLPGWTKSIKRKAIAKAKFYFFDIGIRNNLAKIKNIDPKSDLYGQAFEHFIILEVRAYLKYSRINETLSYWQAKNGYEVDLIIGNEVAIEIKATNSVSDNHLKGLKMLQEEKICTKYFLISQDKIARNQDDIEIRDYKDFLARLWAGEII
jgi:uncharacterized protein